MGKWDVQVKCWFEAKIFFFSHTIYCPARVMGRGVNLARTGTDDESTFVCRLYCVRKFRGDFTEDSEYIW